MTTTAELAEFVVETTYDDLSEDTVDELEKRVLDSVGIAVGAMGEEPAEAVRATVEEMGEGGTGIAPCGVAAAPPRRMRPC